MQKQLHAEAVIASTVMAQDLGAGGSQAAAADDTALIEAQLWVEKAASPIEFFAQKISNTTKAAVEFEEDPPRRLDPSRDQFDRALSEAGELAREIIKIEHATSEQTEDAGKRLAPLQRDLALSGIRAWRLVVDGKVPNQLIIERALEAGIKQHGNASIPCSPLIRAIFADATSGKDTAIRKRMQRRATTFAGAIDYVIRAEMTDEAFSAELEARRKRGTYHGIEDLAKKGRAARRAAKPTPQPSLPPMSYQVAGDFAGVQPGTYLMCVDVAGGAAEMVSAILTVPDELIRRALSADQKARQKAAA